MSERNEGKFEGMVLAKLSALEERMDEVLDTLRAIENRCMVERAAVASLAAEVRALRDRANFNTRVIWSAVAWIVVAAASLIAAALGLGR